MCIAYFGGIVIVAHKEAIGIEVYYNSMISITKVCFIIGAVFGTLLFIAIGVILVGCCMYALHWLFTGDPED